MERFFLNLKMERVWQKDYANHAEATNDIADYIVRFTTQSDCTENCATYHPTLSSVNRHLKNLSNCPKVLDHYIWGGIDVGNLRHEGC